MTSVLEYLIKELTEMERATAPNSRIMFAEGGYEITKAKIPAFKKAIKILSAEIDEIGELEIPMEETNIQSITILDALLILNNISCIFWSKYTTEITVINRNGNKIELGKIPKTEWEKIHKTIESYEI